MSTSYGEGMVLKTSSLTRLVLGSTVIVRSPEAGREAMRRISPCPSMSTSCPGGTVVQLGRRIGLERFVPHRPQRAVFRTEPPQREGIDSQRMGGPHLVQRGHAIQKPHIVTNIVVVEIGKVRIHGLVIEIHVRLGILGFEPCILRRYVVHGLRRRAFLLALLHRPVIAVIGDRANDFFLRNDL